eukprot:1924610-Pleurochrysis_carterae.AAC.2
MRKKSQAATRGASASLIASSVFTRRMRIEDEWGAVDENGLPVKPDEDNVPDGDDTSQQKRRAPPKL